MDLVVGTTGQIGSGKDTVGDLIAAELDAFRIDISDIVRQSASVRSISLARGSLTAFSAEMLARYGPHYFVDPVIESIRRDNTRSAAVVSSIRSESNVHRFRDAFGSKFRLVAVGIPDKSIRYARIRRRSKGRDPLDDAQLEENDRLQEYTYGISRVIGMADFVLDNSGNFDELRDRVSEVCGKMLE